MKCEVLVRCVWPMQPTFVFMIGEVEEMGKYIRNADKAVGYFQVLVEEGIRGPFTHPRGETGNSGTQFESFRTESKLTVAFFDHQRDTSALGSDGANPCLRWHCRINPQWPLTVIMEASKGIVRQGDKGLGTREPLEISEDTKLRAWSRGCGACFGAPARSCKKSYAICWF